MNTMMMGQRQDDEDRAKVLSERKFDQVGLLIDMTSRDYWAKKAIEMAEEELS
jgi:regulation of enolase protein 1 (concanavalin A-like superfamily)